MNKKFSLPAVSSPSECLEELRKRTPGYIRLSFAAAVVLGMVVHLYMFTNKFTNHDDVTALFGNEYGVPSGRWLLPVMLHLDGEFSMPWLIGVLSVLCLAGAVCCTVSLLRVRKPVGCVVTAAVMVAFPSTVSTFTYMFTADAYFFSLLLACFGAWAAVRWGWMGSALGAVCICLSLGIYQSYLPVAMVLMVGAMLFETLDGEKSFQALFLKGLRLVGTLAAGVAIYMTVVAITTRESGLVDYMGISQMGRIPLGELPWRVYAACRQYISHFLRNDMGCHFGFMKYAFCLTAVGAAATGVSILVKRRLGPARTALAVALAAAYPVAGAFIYIMVNPGIVHTLMIYGLVFILVLPVGLMDYADGMPEDGPARTACAVVSWVVVVTVALTAYGYAILDNNAYFKMDLGKQQSVAYSNRLLERVESCEGYERGMGVVLVGSNEGADDPSLSPTPELDGIPLIGVVDLKDFRTSYSYAYYLRYILGFPGAVYIDGMTQAAQMAGEMEEVQAMPVYPEDGSVRVIQGAVVVKLN